MRFMTHVLIVALLWIPTAACQVEQSVGTGQKVEPLTYTVTLDPDMLSTYSVALSIPADVKGEIRLVLPSWTIGRWRPRPWKTRLDSIKAASIRGDEVSVTRREETILVNGKAPLQVTFLLGETRQTDSVHRYFTETGALLEGAKTFPLLLGAEKRPARVIINGPREWQTASNLSAATEKHQFIAPDYAALIDGALLCGTLHERAFQVAGARYRVVLDRRGAPGSPNLDVLREPLEKLATAHDRLHGPLPQGRWTLLLVENARGIRRHDDGITYGLPGDGLDGDLTELMMAVSESLARTRLRRRVLPAELLEPDYLQPVESKELWFTEGWPRWAGRLALLQTGVAPATWREDLAATILEHRNHLLTPRVSPEDASKAIAGAADTLPARLCGHVVSAVADLRVRAASESRTTLASIVRDLAVELNGEKPFTSTMVSDAMTDAGMPEVAKEFDRHATSTAAIDWDEVLAGVALRFEWIKWRVADPRLRCETLGDEVVVSDLPRRTALYAAGLREGDHIRAVDQKRVKHAVDVYRAIGRMKPGRKIRLDIKRDGRPRSIRATLGAAVALDLPVDVRGNVVRLEALPPGNARDAGLREGDVIVKIGNVRIGGRRELRQALSRLKSKSTPITIQRNGKRKVVKVKTPLRVTWRGFLQFDDKAGIDARKRLTELERE